MKQLVFFNICRNYLRSLLPHGVCLTIQLLFVLFFSSHLHRFLHQPHDFISWATCTEALSDSANICHMWLIFPLIISGEKLYVHSEVLTLTFPPFTLSVKTATFVDNSGRGRWKGCGASFFHILMRNLLPALISFTGFFLNCRCTYCLFNGSGLCIRYVHSNR